MSVTETEDGSIRLSAQQRHEMRERGEVHLFHIMSYRSKCGNSVIPQDPSLCPSVRRQQVLHLQSDPREASGPSEGKVPLSCSVSSEHPVYRQGCPRHSPTTAVKFFLHPDMEFALLFHRETHFPPAYVF